MKNVPKATETQQTTTHDKCSVCPGNPLIIYSQLVWDTGVFCTDVSGGFQLSKTSNLSWLDPMLDPV